MTLSSEAAVLLAVARTSLEPQDVARLRAAIDAGPDPTALLDRARRHGLAPMLYRHLYGYSPDALPVEAMAQLRRQYQFHALENLRLLQELIHLLGQLRSQGVSAIPWKGVTLGLAVYGDLALRKAGDLDLLVDPSALPRALDVMHSLGFRVTTTLRANGEPTDWDQYEYRLVHDEKDLTVELPRRIPPRWRWFSVSLSWNRLWERQEEIAVAGGMLPSLPPEEMLLFLCFHGARHHWDRLMWVCDIAELIRMRPALDWDRILGGARSLGYQRILTLGLFLAQRLLDAPVPDAVWQQIPLKRPVSLLADRLLQYHGGMTARSSNSDKPYPVEDRRGHRQYEFTVTERLVDRVRYRSDQAVQRIIPNRKDRAWISLPSELDFLYYVLRPVRLLTVYGAGTTRRLFALMNKSEAGINTDVRRI